MATPKTTPAKNSGPQAMHFKRGEALFGADQRYTSIYVIQSGTISVRLEKEGNIELYVAGAGQSLCDEALFLSGTCPYGAIALKDTSVIKIPLELARKQLDGLSPPQLAVLKGYGERLKAEFSELKSLQVARSNLPCPAALTPRLFGSIFHTVKELGTEKDGAFTIDWETLKRHATNVYHESPVRLEQGVFILAKVGHADIFWEGSSVRLDGTQEPKSLRIRKMPDIETFFEFYQNYLYKPGGTEILKTNEKMTIVARTFLKVADRYPPQRDGMVRMPFKEAIEEMKGQLGQSFEPDQLFRLEQKGLMIKRIASDTGGTLVFIRQEFDQMLLNWSLLKEIEKWNTVGFVDLGNYKAPPVAPTPEVAASVVVTSEKTPALPPKPRPQRALAEILAGFLPAVLKRKVPSIVTEPAKPNEQLCSVCMSALTPGMDVCATCDTPVGDSNGQAA